MFKVNLFIPFLLHTHVEHSESLVFQIVQQYRNIRSEDTFDYKYLKFCENRKQF